MNHDMNLHGIILSIGQIPLPFIYSQTDTATFDFGYMVNRGWTHTNGVYNEAEDDVFVVNVELQMSDLSETNVDGSGDDDIHDIHFAVAFDDIVFVGE